MKQLILLLAISTSLFAQTNKYPCKKIIDFDTVCCLSINQVRQVNLTYVDLDYYHSLSDTLNSNLDKLKFITNEQDQLINLQKSDMIIKQSIIDNQMLQIVKYISLDKKSHRQIQWLKVQRNVLAIGVGVAILKIFVFH